MDITAFRPGMIRTGTAIMAITTTITVTRTTGMTTWIRRIGI